MEFLDNGGYIMGFMNGIKLALVAVLTLTISFLLDTGNLTAGQHLNTNTRELILNQAFGLALVGLVVAGICLGFFLAKPSVATFVMAAGFYGLGLGLYSVAHSQALSFTWPLTGAMALGVWYLVAWSEPIGSASGHYASSSPNHP